MPIGQPYDQLDALLIISLESIRIWLYISVHLSVFIPCFMLSFVDMRLNPLHPLFYTLGKTVKFFSVSAPVGDKALNVRLTIMETMIMPTILINTETWTNKTKQEMEIIEKMQKDILTSLFHLRPCYTVRYS